MRGPVARTAFCRTATAGPVALRASVVQVGVTPRPLTCWRQAATATGTGNAFHVAASTTPVTLTLCAPCQAATAFWVNGPKSPSAVVPTAEQR